MSGLKEFKDLFFLQLSGRTCGHEEELRQDRQMEEALTPEVKTQRAVLPMGHLLMKSKEEPPDQKEWSPSVDQQDTEPAHVKEEQEELRISLEGEQLHGPDEDIVKFTFFPASVKSEDEEEVKSSQLCQTQSEQTETGADGEDCGESEQARNLILERGLCRETEVKTEDVSEPKPEGCKDLMNPAVDQPTSVVSKCQSLKRHRKLHSCSCCGKIFNKKSNLTRHMRIHTEEKPFSCPECGKTFKQPSHLKGHMAHHREEKPFGCDTCRKSFIWPYQLKKHECAGFYVPDPFERQINGERLAETGPGEEGAEESEENENSDPEGHSEPEVEVKIEDVSEAETDDSGDWEESAEQHSGGEKSDATRHSCSLCGKVFKNKWYMTTHMKNHMGERHFSCSECGKTFNHKGNMNRHKRIHRRPEPSSSPERGEKSNPKPCLKLFGCSECGKRFIYQWHLNRHMVIHTGERRFICSVCGKRFKQKSYLTLHMARHRGEKLYSCSVCGQRFVWPAQLKKHKCVSSTVSDPRENHADGGRRASSRTDGGDCSGAQEVRNSDPEGLSLPETGVKVEEFSEPEDSQMFV